MWVTVVDVCFLTGRTQSWGFALSILPPSAAGITCMCMMETPYTLLYSLPSGILVISLYFCVCVRVCVCVCVCVRYKTRGGRWPGNDLLIQDQIRIREFLLVPLCFFSSQAPYTTSDTDFEHKHPVWTSTKKKTTLWWKYPDIYVLSMINWFFIHKCFITGSSAPHLTGHVILIL